MCGRAETATDPAPLEMFETTIQFKPRDQWRAGMTPEKLINEHVKRNNISKDSYMEGVHLSHQLLLDLCGRKLCTPFPAPFLSIALP